MLHTSFIRRRVAELRSRVGTELVAEFERNPIGLNGDQSADLAELLNFLRAETPMQGRAFVYVERPGEAYRLARFQEFGRPPTLGPTFRTEAEAAAAVIRDRLQALGISIDSDFGATITHGTGALQ